MSDEVLKQVKVRVAELRTDSIEQLQEYGEKDWEYGALQGEAEAYSNVLGLIEEEEKAARAAAAKVEAERRNADLVRADEKYASRGEEQDAR
jgi:hypothetical protein